MTTYTLSSSKHSSVWCLVHISQLFNRCQLSRELKYAHIDLHVPGTPVQLDWVLCKHHIIIRKRGERTLHFLKGAESQQKDIGRKEKSD